VSSLAKASGQRHGAYRLTLDVGGRVLELHLLEPMYRVVIFDNFEQME
jgi:hypothetical protein